MAQEYRQLIQDALVTAFAALVHPSDSVPIFPADSVGKVFVKDLTNLPRCVIVATGMSPVNVYGNDTDIRPYSWNAEVYEILENAETEAEAIVKINRMSSIEDAILKYLEKIPNPIEHTITGIHITNISLQGNNIAYQQTETGIAVYLTVSFITEVVISPQLL